jgi:hypothetical protein
MSGKGNVVFDFVDVYDDRVDERIDVTLKHNVLSQSAQKKDHLVPASLLLLRQLCIRPLA